jgi:hypothetical protein
MFIYTIIEGAVGVVALILFEIFTRKKDDVVYNKLDRLGRILNVVLLAVYVGLSPFYGYLGMISYPCHTGLLGAIGWGIAIVNASAAFFCDLAIGFSIVLRRKGKSKLSFAVQFTGFIAIALTVSMYFLFAGTLLNAFSY